jgi:hypothetical protein
MSIGTTVGTHDFIRTLAGVTEMTDELAGKLLAVGCDDASLCGEGPLVFLCFSREAESLGDAIGSAVKDVARAGLAVARVDVKTAKG